MIPKHAGIPDKRRIEFNPVRQGFKPLANSESPLRGLFKIQFILMDFSLNMEINFGRVSFEICGRDLYICLPV
jgi:hypothetical protein